MDRDDNIVGSTCELDRVENSSVLDPKKEEEEKEKEEEEKDMDNFIKVDRLELCARDNIHGWKELQDQIKLDMNKMHKQYEPLTYINKLLILRYFVTLCIKGVKCIVAS